MEGQDFSNLVNNLKNILNSTNSSTPESGSSEGALNITPEMISNIANTLKSSNSDNNSTNKNHVNSNKTTNTKTSNDFDISTILRVQKIVESLNNKDDARSNLLNSLKPYLRESRKQKVDQYVNLFKLSGLTDILKKDKGDSN